MLRSSARPSVSSSSPRSVPKVKCEFLLRFQDVVARTFDRSISSALIRLLPVPPCVACCDTRFCSCFCSSPLMILIDPVIFTRESMKCQRFVPTVIPRTRIAVTYQRRSLLEQAHKVVVRSTRGVNREQLIRSQSGGVCEPLPKSRE